MLQKIRQPDSLAGAVSAVCDVIGWARASEIVGRAESTIRQWGNPDIIVQIDSIQSAILLDAAFTKATKKPGPISARMADAARELAGIDIHEPKSLSERLIDLHSEIGDVHAAVRDAISEAGDGGKKITARERKAILTETGEARQKIAELERDVKRVS